MYTAVPSKKNNRHTEAYEVAKMGSVAGSLIQANGKLTFEDDLRSGGVLCFISMNASTRTELVDSMVTLGEPGDD